MRFADGDHLLDQFRPGRRIFIQGSSGEIAPLIDLFRSAPERLAGVELWSCLVPGVNSFDYGALHPDARIVTFMASPALAPSISGGQTRIIGLPYSAMAESIASTPFDLAILHCSQPDESGACSFGVACDTAALALGGAAKVAAFLNVRMPRLPRADGLRLTQIDIAIACDSPLIEAAPMDRASELDAIGAHIANLVDDGATIQAGIGQAPAAALLALQDHRRLHFHSGLITPEYRALHAAGALHDDHDNLSGIAFGNADFYSWLEQADLARFADASQTHGAAALAATPRFTSMNSALEIDLLGQINIEWRGDTRISSLGGAPDYMAGAAASPGGQSIIALPATTKSGASRIVPRLAPDRVSIPGHFTDAVVTQHGTARVKGMTGDQRARALIAIADPAHREGLEHAWADLRA